MKPKIWMLALFVLLAMTVIGVISAKIDGWDTAPNTQYHIQTDEGPERFFKYQTISGQYRKEKRLQDGTVVGSYGWVDADGYLRLNDYIADNDGYRILKTKRLFVGSQTSAPVSSPSPSSAPFLSTKYVPAVTANDVSSPAFEKAPPPPSPSSSYVVEDKSKFLIFPSTTVSPIAIFPKRRPTAPIAYYPTSTPPNIVRESSDPVTEVAITPAPHYYVPAKSSYPGHKSSSSSLSSYKVSPFYTTVVKPRPDYSSPNAIVNLVSPLYGDKLYSPLRKSFDTATTYPQGGVKLLTGNGGFRYYLPRQYHEEQSSVGGDERIGSFGYIDPFGIRRVVYYNAAPGTGFVHRKSNRYVGFNATPYDPQPIPL